ncbi:MAG: Ig-like domain-containing protein [Bacteroidota bacterium]
MRLKFKVRLVFVPLLPLFALLLGLQFTVHAQTLINPTTWTGQGTSGAGPSTFTTLPASVLPGAAIVNVSQWNRDGALTNTSAGSCYNSSNWQLGGSLAAAIAANSDVFFTITNDATTELQVTQLFIMSQVSATGPTNAQLRYTIGSTSANYGPGISTAHTASPENWTLNDNICIGPGQTATFRLYAWGGANTAGTLRINNSTAITAYFAAPVTVTAASNSPVCEGDTIKFTGGAGGGVGPYTYNWSGPLSFSSTSLNPIIVPATVPASGTYTLTVTDALNCSTLSGTGATAVIVNPTPPAITGATTVCHGSTTTLANATAGGTWSSGNTSIATVGLSTGIVTGVAPGTASITYTAPTGCFIATVITVNALPPAITGTAFVCIGLTTTLANASAGGTWSSSDIAIATIGLSSGIVTGVASGTAVITYTATTGCIATRIATVTLLPSGITGPLAACPGTTTTLSNTTGGGTWSSSNTSIATIGVSSGIATGVSPGTTTITYTVGVGCTATAVLTVNPLPAAITGTRVVCAGLNTLLSNATAGGTWSSSNTGIATIAAATGLVTGIAGGTATVSYILAATGCYSTAIVTVNPLPAAISGPSGVCVGTTATLSSASAGGTWTSGNTAVATIGVSSGIVSGLVAGTSIITYRLNTGCITTRTQTVHPLPAAIAGPAFVCANGGTITLSNTSGGGTWASSNPAVATAGAATGVITGVVAGSVTITYTLPTGCIATTGVSVNPAPPALITPLGDTTVCPGGFVALTANAGTGLTYQWFADGSAIAGAVALTYIATVSGSHQVRTINSFGCPTFSTPMLVTIDTPLALISTPGGSFATCSGTAISLDANTGTGLSYQWQLDGVSIPGATAASYVTSTPGTYVLVVSNSTGCIASDTVELTVNPSPSGLVSLSGPAVFCQSGSVVMTAETGASYTYQWYNTIGAIAGATNVYYTTSVSGSYSVVVTNGFSCVAASLVMAVVVNPLPSVAIVPGGPLVVCAPGTVTLNASSGGSLTYQWYKGGAPIAGATNAAYVALSSGNYRVRVLNTATGCSDITHADTVVTVVSSPAIIPLTPASFCWGGNSILSTSVSSAAGLQYQWFRNGTLIAGATSLNYVADIAGSYTVRITVPASCIVTTIALAVVEHPLPNPVISYNASTHRLSTQTYFVSYQWYKDNVLIPGATNAVFTAIGTGNYKVAVTDTNGCQSFAAAYPLTNWTGGGTTGIGTAAAEQILVYPNPARNTVYIQAAQPVSADVKCIDGRVAISRQQCSEINIASLADGIYILTIYSEDGRLLKTEKLVKANR